MYIFKEYLLSLSHFQLKFGLKYWFLLLQLSVEERAVFAPPPFHTKKWAMQFKLFFSITTYINDSQ